MGEGQRQHKKMGPRTNIPSKSKERVTSSQHKVSVSSTMCFPLCFHEVISRGYEVAQVSSASLLSFDLAGHESFLSMHGVMKPTVRLMNAFNLLGQSFGIPASSDL